MYIDNLVLSSRNLKALKWLKNKLMREFNIKDLGEVKKIIRWEITRKKDIFKIDQKRYIQDLLESKRMTSYYPTILLVKTGSTFILN